MNDWLLYIKDGLDHFKEVRGPGFIPRIGDRVYMGYSPFPTVDEVAISYEDKKIFVTCK